MKYVLSPRLIQLANNVAKIPLAKHLLKPFYYSYKNKLENKRNLVYRNNALNILHVFDRIMTNSHIDYTLAFGTLLGAVREHGFIKHDLDIDIFLWIEDTNPLEIKKILENEGFSQEHVFLVEKGKLGREETYSMDGVSLDVFYIYPPIGKYCYVCDFQPLKGSVTWEQSQRKYGAVGVRRLEMPISKKRVKMQFEDCELYVPANYNEFLRFRYGDDFMVPNPKWHNGANPNIFEWDNVHASYYKR